ncbi:SH3 domain-containing protein [Arcicella sp. DC2W]|uniref:SH3 domain-containing protein n=1 Tax=Arcicella gelida TaxID=2984195 RepID=A0ABU5SBR1_9BACT|nr:SH3 domain-containing protein [Arcicella sp. DC2W]MEA5405942.1 SH3 domain-containing protein [Arcicella sp. DC2W]
MKNYKHTTINIQFVIKIIIVILIANVIEIESIYSQTYSTTTTANCGKCGKTVSSSAKVGDSCPHCGVRWGKENKTTTNIKSNKNSTTGLDINPFALDQYSSPTLGNDITSNQSNPRSYSNVGDLYELTNVVRNCNLRSAPNNESEVMIRLLKNSEITVTKRVGSWVKVQYLSREGLDTKWIHGWIHVSNIVQ